MNSKPQEEKASEDARVTRVALVDDDALVRHVLGAFINHQPDMMVCGESESPLGAQEVIQESRADIVLVDHDLKDGNGIELIRELKSRGLDLPVLMVSVHEDPLYVARALAAGASGYVSKKEASEGENAALLRGIQTVLEGNIFLTRRMAIALAQRILQPESGVPKTPDSELLKLSGREQQVFRLLAEGHSTRQIASRLEVSIKTVQAHRANIKEKFELETSSALLIKAIEWGRNNAPS